MSHPYPKRLSIVRQKEKSHQGWQGAPDEKPSIERQERSFWTLPLKGENPEAARDALNSYAGNLHAVADGMGGHHAGDIASQEVRVNEEKGAHETPVYQGGSSCQCCDHGLPGL